MGRGGLITLVRSWQDIFKRLRGADLNLIFGFTFRNLKKSKKQQDPPISLDRRSENQSNSSPYSRGTDDGLGRQSVLPMRDGKNGQHNLLDPTW